MNEWINQPTNQSINQSINVSINQSINLKCMINQSINHRSIGQSFNRSINRLSRTYFFMVLVVSFSDLMLVWEIFYSYLLCVFFSIYDTHLHLLVTYHVPFLIYYCNFSPICAALPGIKNWFLICFINLWWRLDLWKGPRRIDSPSFYLKMQEEAVSELLYMFLFK